jgi:integrase/recombinase XerD
MFGMYLETIGIKNTEDIRHVDISNYLDSLVRRGKYTICTVKNQTQPNYPENRKDLGKPISACCINNYLRNLNAFFNWCIEEEFLRKNPIKRSDFIKTKRKEVEFIDDEDFKMLLDCLQRDKFFEYRDWVIIQLLIDTGMRCGECLLIKMEDIDFRKNAILLPAENTKGKKDRYVFFSAQMEKTIKRWITYKDRYRESDYLFCTNQGKALQVNNLEANIRKYAARVGLKNVHPHMFRNNFAKRFLKSGGDIYTLSRILGHSSVVITEKAYLDINEDDLMEMYASHSPLENMKYKPRNH